MRVMMDVKGVDDLVRQLQRLSVDAAQNYIREAGRAGAEIIREDAAARVNTGPHSAHLKDNLVIEETRERDSRIDFAIGPAKAQWYGRLVEFGHAVIRVTNRIRNAKGRTVRRITQDLGQVPPHPFLRPALDTKRSEANAKVAEVLRRRFGQ